MKKSLKDDMRRVLKSTVDYYSQDPEFRRCYVEGEGCSYSPHKLNIEEYSKGCAIGRMINDKDEQSRLETWYGNAYSPTIHNVNDTFLVNNFNGELPKVSSILSKYPIEFLSALQELHDASYLWNSKNGGLTYQGKVKVRKINKLINKFK